jgi:hypothetical protein
MSLYYFKKQTTGRVMAFEINRYLPPSKKESSDIEIHPEPHFNFPSADEIEINFAGHSATKNLSDIYRPAALEAARAFQGRRMCPSEILPTAKTYVQVALNGADTDASVLKDLSVAVAKVVYSSGKILS